MRQHKLRLEDGRELLEGRERLRVGINAPVLEHGRSAWNMLLARWEVSDELLGGQDCANLERRNRAIKFISNTRRPLKRNKLRLLLWRRNVWPVEQTTTA